MALWICNACTTAYAVGLERCPHCRSTDYRPDHPDRGAAPAKAAAPVPVAAAPALKPPAAPAPAAEPAPDQGEAAGV